MENNSVAIPQQILDAIEAVWIERAYEQDLPVTSKKYLGLELEFFCGAMAALQATNPEYHIPPKWYVALLRGDAIVTKDRHLDYAKYARQVGQVAR